MYDLKEYNNALKYYKKALENKTKSTYHNQNFKYREVYNNINERIITSLNRDILRDEIQLYGSSNELEINSNSTEIIRDICDCIYYPYFIVEIFRKK